MKVRLLTPEEFRAADDKRLLLGGTRNKDEAWKKAHNSPYGWARLTEITGPGVMWYASWFFDPKDPNDQPMRLTSLEEIKAGKYQKNRYLSRFYWEDWSDKRPPICVLCPNGEEWCVDACSTNGEGWKVTGEPPNITCHPSIMVPGYHGFLRNGEFT